MTVVALRTILAGGREVQPGEVVPESVTFLGRERPVDVDRLVAKGLAERVKPKPKSSGPRKSSSKSSAGAE